VTSQKWSISFYKNCIVNDSCFFRKFYHFNEKKIETVACLCLFTFFRRFGLYASNLAVAAHLLGREQQTNSKGQSGDRIQFYRTNVANKNESNNKFHLQIKTVSLNSALKTRINQNNNRKMLIRKNALSSKLTKYPVKEKLHPLLQYSKVELCMRDIHRDRSNFDLYACYSITQNLAFSFNYWVRGLTVRNTEMLFISDFLFRFYYYFFRSHVSGFFVELFTKHMMIHLKSFIYFRYLINS